MNIFKTLQSNNVCFAVVVSKQSFLNRVFSYDYFLIMLKKDNPAERIEIEDEKTKTKKTKVKFKYDFKESHTDRTLLERTLNDEETEFFKTKIIDKFNLTHTDESGRVYEMKNNSFKKKLNKLNT